MQQEAAAVFRMQSIIACYLPCVINGHLLHLIFEQLLNPY